MEQNIIDNHELKDKISRLANDIFPRVKEIRQHLHQYPELSYEEYETADYVQAILTKEGIPFKGGVVDTGIVATIEGKNPAKKLVALRADMDALPVEEKNQAPYCSRNPGIMHACGHDAHTASLLGAAMILNQLKENFEGTVMLIFQPGEEKLPGGAKLMLEEGIFADQVPDLIIAQHVLPELESGMVGFRPGLYMASCDEIFLTVKGKGGHGAMPHKITDTVLITSHIIVAMQQVVSRLADASIPSVLSFGKVIANGATNIIPPEVKVEGTFRTMNEKWRTSAHEHITRIARLTAEAMGGQCDIRIDKGYPVLKNHEDYTRQIHQLANEYLGSEKTIDMDIRMTAEDFAYFTREYPCVYYRLGVKKPGQKEILSLHSPTFDIDESALETGSGLMAWLAASFLEPEKKDNLV